MYSFKSNFPFLTDESEEIFGDVSLSSDSDIEAEVLHAQSLPPPSEPLPGPSHDDDEVHALYLILLL